MCMYIEYSGITFSFSDNIFTDVICCLQFERLSFVALKIYFSVHIMKVIAWHGVVNQFMLKVGIIGTAQLLWLLGFMLEVPGSTDNQLTYFHVQVVKRSQF